LLIPSLSTDNTKSTTGKVQQDHRKVQINTESTTKLSYITELADILQTIQPTMNKFLQELQASNLTADKIEAIISKGKLIQIKSQTRLISPNQTCDKGYFVLKGGFVCRYIDEQLEIEKTINFFLPELHPFMSCVDSFFSGEKTQCELRAISNSEVIEFKKKDLEILLNEDLQFFQFYHSLVTRALQEENDFKLKIIAYSSERLYNYLLTNHPVIIQKVPSKYIAEFMGISSEWLSKLKHRI
jgi:hypothetical protein